MAARPAARTVQLSQRVVTAAAAAADAAPQAVAHLRYNRGSPLKVRRVLDQIRGRSYEEAIMMLEYMPYKVQRGRVAGLGWLAAALLAGGGCVVGEARSRERRHHGRWRKEPSRSSKNLDSCQRRRR